MIAASRFARVILTVTAAGLTTGSARLDAGQHTQPHQRPPIFCGEAVLVTVDVQVLEDGKLQTVELTEFVRVEPGLSETARRDPNSTREMPVLARPLA